MAKLKVLVVDDAAFIREMVRKTLRSRFPAMQVEDAINGRKAQLLLEKVDYDLVLCDWEMPEMSGIELLNWIRQEKQSRVPFVMVTSRGDKANVVEAIQAGVSDYIGKPFSSDGLIAKVTKVMSKHHNLQDLNESTNSGTGRVGDGSINALTASRINQKPAAKSAAVAKPAAQKAPAKASKPIATKGSAQLRFGDQANQCLIKALSLKQLVLICKVSEGLPSILETVVVDLEQQTGASNEVARINAFVRTLQANDSSIDCELVTVTVDIIDQDANKLGYLSRMIASGTTQRGYIPGA
ncbi:MAG: response regulator [Halopseudomonas sp.]